MFTQNDSVQCWNLVRALKKGKFELDGEEIIAFSKMFQWVSNLCLLIDTDVKRDKSEKLMGTAEVVDPALSVGSPSPPVAQKQRRKEK